MGPPGPRPVRNRVLSRNTFSGFGGGRGNAPHATGDGMILLSRRQLRAGTAGLPAGGAFVPGVVPAGRAAAPDLSSRTTSHLPGDSGHRVLSTQVWHRA
jgi:hypothetical protein